ncbi:hypothetical protein DL768_001455 [Monosporascus sp. mg162]|nr:hypothetical protein DL768_001455 [Monosporascus sp. mg162]
MFGLFDNTFIPGEWTWPLLVAPVVILITAMSRNALFRRAPTQKDKPQRHLTLRIDDVPSDKSREALKNDLRSIATRDSGLQETINTLSRLTLVRRNEHSACATASFRTSIPEDVLLGRLRCAGEGLPYRYDCKFYGITPLYEDETSTKVDVITVPGLASHAIGSWKSPSSSDVWLRDYLPVDLPNVRVLLYGYDTKLLKSDSRISIQEMGVLFLQELRAFRVASNALLHARKKSIDRANLEVSNACCGLLFFGVPNFGLRNEQLQSIVEGQPNQNLIRDLVVDSDSEPSAFLKRISNDFSNCYKGQYRVVSFYETKHSPTVQIQPDGQLSKTGPKVLMVTEKSATSTGLTAVLDEDNIGFDTDHSGLVKYDSRNQGMYPIVRERLEMIISEDVPRIAKRFQDNLTSDEKRSWNNLNLPPYSSFRNSAKLAKPEKGTLQWLIEGKDLDSPPGQGKSVLSNFVLQHLESNTPGDSKIIYYFCNIKNDEASRNAKSILRALIVQLCENQQRLFLYAKRPLRCNELADAVALSPTDRAMSYDECSKYRPSVTPDEIRRSLGTLLDVVDSTVYLIHQSVKDFFEKENPLRDAFGPIVPRLVPAYASMAYLHFDDIRYPILGEELKERFPFLPYAAEYWYLHVESAKDIYDQPLLQGLLREIVDPASKKIQLWRNYGSRGFKRTVYSTTEVAMQLDIGWLAELLLDRKIEGLKDDFEEDCLSNGARLGGLVFRVLLKHERTKEFALPVTLVQEVAKRCNDAAVRLLLEERGDDIQITPTVVKAAAENPFNGEQVIRLLFEERGDDIEITPAVVEAAAGNDNGERIIRLLFEKRGDDIEITPAVVEAAAENGGNGEKVIRLLFEKCGNNIEITPAVVEAAAANGSGPESTAPLLCGIKVPVTTTLDTADHDHEEMPATTAAALAAERAAPLPAAHAPPLQTNVNVNGADAGEGEGTESMEVLCRELKAKVDGFLARETDDPVLRSTQAQVRVGLGVVDEALRRYRPVELSLSYNGGKDCLVLLILILAALPSHFPPSSSPSSTSSASPSTATVTTTSHPDSATTTTSETNSSIPNNDASSSPPPPPSKTTAAAAEGPVKFPTSFQALYIRPPSPFPEVDAFVASSAARYRLDLTTSDRPMKAALTEYLGASGPGRAVRAVFVGTRRTDPHGAALSHFDETDHDWPRFMRIHPVIDWHYREVWRFIRALEIPYCSLYDKGYTSLGGTDDTHPNPALKRDERKIGDGNQRFRPAYELMEDEEERLGRDR